MSFVNPEVDLAYSSVPKSFIVQRLLNTSVSHTAALGNMFP